MRCRATQEAFFSRPDRVGLEWVIDRQGGGGIISLMKLEKESWIFPDRNDRRNRQKVRIGALLGFFLFCLMGKQAASSRQSVVVLSFFRFICLSLERGALIPWRRVYRWCGRERERERGCRKK